MLHDAASPDVDWIAISHATPHATERWCAAIGGIGGGGMLVVSDSSRRTYAASSLPQTDLAYFLGRRSLTDVARPARRGIRNRHPNGSRWQSAGTFVLDVEAIVRGRHLPDHAGDLPNLDAAVHALQ
jgi:hypothetical protein